MGKARQLGENIRSDREFEEINYMRVHDHGLPPIKRGIKRCMRCEQSFHAEDMANQGYCPACRNVVGRSGGPFIN